MAGYVIPDKVNKFLSSENTKRLIKKIYQRHVWTGGVFTYDDFAVQVPNLMKAWDKLPKLNTYVSLIYGDVAAEMEAINKDFIEDNRTAWDAGSEYKTLVATNTMLAEDYRLLDVTHAADDITSNRNMRYDNTLPIYQTSMNTRNYETHGDAMHTSLMAEPASYNMQELYDTIDRPYKQIDYLDQVYYGPSDNNDDSTTALEDTNWS